MGRVDLRDVRSMAGTDERPRDLTRAFGQMNGSGHAYKADPSRSRRRRFASARAVSHATRLAALVADADALGRALEVMIVGAGAQLAGADPARLATAGGVV